MNHELKFILLQNPLFPECDLIVSFSGDQSQLRYALQKESNRGREDT
jgi:hypothetical protein